MATPVLAGIVALVRQYYVDGYFPTGSPVAANKILPSAALLKATVLNCARPLVGKVYDSTASKMTDLPTSFPNAFYGFGRPDLSRILKIATSAATTLKLYIDDVKTPGLATGESKEYRFEGVTSSGTSPFTVTLVWTDPPGSLTSSNQLVNNLDLVCIAGQPPPFPFSFLPPYPSIESHHSCISLTLSRKLFFFPGGGCGPSVVSCSHFFCFCFFVGDTTTTSYFGNGGTSADTVNNVESVVLTSLASATTVRARVSGTNVAVNKYGFSHSM